MRVKKKKAAKKKKGKKKGKKSNSKSMSMTMSPVTRKGSISESPSPARPSIKKTTTKASAAGDSAAKGKAGDRNPTPGSDKKVTAVDNEMSIDLTTEDGEGAFAHLGRRETHQPSHDLGSIKENVNENSGDIIAEEPENKEDNDSNEEDGEKDEEDKK